MSIAVTNAATGSAALAPQNPYRCQHAIVVFGCATSSAGAPTPGLVSRLRRAIEEARRDPKALIVVTGGAVRGPAEGPVMRDWLVSHGVDAGRICVEDRARNTLDNVRRVMPLLERAEVSRVTLVTEAFHMPRSCVLMLAELRQRGGRSIIVSEAAAPTIARADELHRRLAHEVAALRRDSSAQRRAWRR